MHDSHVGGPKQYNDFPLGNIFFSYANIFYCFSPPTWPLCTHSIVANNLERQSINPGGYLHMLETGKYEGLV